MLPRVSVALRVGAGAAPRPHPARAGFGGRRRRFRGVCASIGGLSDGPITAGETVHINVFDAPDFSLITRVSESGDIPFPILGQFHIEGLNSVSAAQMLAKELKDRNLMLDPEVTVTVDSSSTGITSSARCAAPESIRRPVNTSFPISWPLRED